MSRPSPSGPALLISTTVELREGVAYTLVGADRLAQMAPVVLDDTTGVAVDGQARVGRDVDQADALSVADMARVPETVEAPGVAA